MDVIIHSSYEAMKCFQRAVTQLYPIHAIAAIDITQGGHTV